MANIGIQVNNTEWKSAARIEILHALRVDKTAADLLLQLISIDLDLGLHEEADAYYQRFKLVARIDPLIQFVKDLHERQPPPSLPNP